MDDVTAKLFVLTSLCAASLIAGLLLDVPKKIMLIEVITIAAVCFITVSIDTGFTIRRQKKVDVFPYMKTVTIPAEEERGGDLYGV